MKIKIIICLIVLIFFVQAELIDQDNPDYEWQSILEELRDKTLGSIMFKKCDSQARQFWKLFVDDKYLGSIIQDKVQMLFDKGTFYFRIPYHLLEQANSQQQADDLQVRISVRLDRLSSKQWSATVVRTVPRLQIADADGYVNGY